MEGYGGEGDDGEKVNPFFKYLQINWSLLCPKLVNNIQ